MCRIATRRSEAKVQRQHIAIDAEQQEAQDACTHIVLREGWNELMEYPRGTLQDVFVAHNRFQEGRLDAIARRRNDRHERFRLAPERLIQAAQKGALQAWCEGSARLFDQISDATKAEAQKMGL